MAKTWDQAQFSWFSKVRLTFWPPLVASNVSKNLKSMSTKNGTQLTSITACRKIFIFWKKDPRHVTALEWWYGFLWNWNTSMIPMVWYEVTWHWDQFLDLCSRAQSRTQLWAPMFWKGLWESRVKQRAWRGGELLQDAWCDCAAHIGKGRICPYLILGLLSFLAVSCSLVTNVDGRMISKWLS